MGGPPREITERPTSRRLRSLVSLLSCRQLTVPGGRRWARPAQPYMADVTVPLGAVARSHWALSRGALPGAAAQPIDRQSSGADTIRRRYRVRVDHRGHPAVGA